MAKIKLSKKKLIILISIISTLIIVLAGILTASIIIGNKYKKISVSSTPIKTEYYIGESADYSGLKIQITKRNGKFFFVDYTDKDLEISGFDSSKAGKNTITVKYKGFTSKFIITIKETETVINLTEISLETLPKTDYKVGETLSTDGGVILCTYSDGSSTREELLPRYISGFNSSTSGTYTLTVKYNDGKGILKTTTYQITVSE